MTTEAKPRRKFEYGGLLEMDQSGDATWLRPAVGGAQRRLRDMRKSSSLMSYCQCVAHFTLSAYIYTQTTT